MDDLQFEQHMDALNKINRNVSDLKDDLSDLKQKVSDLDMSISQYHDPIKLENGYGFNIVHGADLGDLLIATILTVIVSIYIIKFFIDLSRK